MTQYYSTPYQSESYRFFTDVNVDTNTLPNIPETTTTTSSSKYKKLIIVGTILGVLVLVGGMAAAIAVPIIINLNNPVTTTTTTTSTSATTTTATTSTTTTQSPYICGNMTLFPSYDLPGDDLISNTLANYTLCCQWCLTYSGCVGYTWGLSTAGSNANHCFLKYAVPALNAGSTFVSAHY